MNTDVCTIELKTISLPGNLGFSKIETSFQNIFLYSRRTDKRLFRLLDAANQNTTTLPGPLSEEYPGSILILKQLYTPR